MVGVSPRSGPAGVNERAGWTDRICFYQVSFVHLLLGPTYLVIAAGAEAPSADSGGSAWIRARGGLRPSEESLEVDDSRFPLQPTGALQVMCTQAHTTIHICFGL